MIAVPRYFKVFFRLSIVFALVAAAIDANNILQSYLSEARQQSEFACKERSTFDCAIRLTDAQLAEVRNEYGLYDVAVYGCGLGSDGKTYFVSDEELAQYRNGIFFATNISEEYFLSSRMNFGSNLAVLLIVFLAVNLLGVILYLTFSLIKWIFK